MRLHFTPTLIPLLQFLSVQAPFSPLLHCFTGHLEKRRSGEIHPAALMDQVLSRPESQYDFVVPYNLIEERLDDDVDTEQHKAHRGQRFFKRSIRHYRHANTRWGAALENFSPMWVRKSTMNVVFPVLTA